MIAAPPTENETQRIAALHALDLLDTPAEERFDRLTRLAGALFDVPIALISLVDSDRQWFKSRVGLTVDHTDRCVSFCAHAIHDDGLFVVEDATQDPRFAGNPLVTGDPGIRFYAGQPLRGPYGERVGTLCIIDREPRRFGQDKRDQLRDLGLLAELEVGRGLPARPAAAAPQGTGAEPGWKRWSKFLSGRAPAMIVALLAVFLILGLGARWDSQNGVEHLQMQEKRVLEVMGAWRGRLETELNTRLHLVHGLSGLVHTNPEVDAVGFDRFAEDLGGEMSAIRSLQLAPDGVVRFVWPLETNRDAIGHDLLADPARRAAAQEAVNARNIWIAGPLQLIQGGVAIIGRRPIFVSNDTGLGEQFWGFATILIDLPQLYESIGISEDVDGVRLALRGVDARGERGEVFFGEAGIFEQNHLRASVALPAGSWELGGVPQQGWLGEWPGRQRFYVVLGLGAVLAGLLLYVLLRLPAQLRVRIAETLASRDRGEQRFSDAIRALQEGFAIFDSADRLVVCNRRYRELFDVCAPIIETGVTYSELVRYGVMQGQFGGFSAPGVQEQEEAVRQRLALHRRPEIRYEEQLCGARWLQVAERQMRDGGTVIFYLDITDLKEKERELIEARKRAEVANTAKTAFLATVSHEVRTPLNSVLGLLGLLREASELPPRQRERAETAHESARHLLVILNEILDISRMEENQLELESGPFLPAETAGGVVRLVEGLARRKDLPLYLHLEGDTDIHVLGDEGRFRQVLLNIISNAVKFTDSGRVDLRLHARKEAEGRVALEIEIEDTGIGFDDACAGQLFEPFSQLESHSGRRFEGAGLGLAICKRLIGLMGGELTAAGTPGVGARFLLRLVLPQAPELSGSDAVEVEPARTPLERGWRTIRVLLVEDSGTNQIVFQAMMEGTGYQVDAVSSGEEALRALADLPYDLVMMDVFMPGLDGLETTRALRKMGTCSDIPVIALTANAMRGDRERFLAAGMDDYLPKPIDKYDLLVLMARWSEQVLERSGNQASRRGLSHMEKEGTNK